MALLGEGDQLLGGGLVVDLVVVFSSSIGVTPVIAQSWPPVLTG
ncbi:hypothetical protein [Streptomyces nigrescens]